MSLNNACHVCDGEYTWRIERYGDAVVSWACNEHLGAACEELQRKWETTRLVVWQPGRSVIKNDAPPCQHPKWREDHDGHHGHGWLCTACGARSAIAPWVLHEAALND